MYPVPGPGTLMNLRVGLISFGFGFGEAAREATASRPLNKNPGERLPGDEARDDMGVPCRE